MMSRKIALCQVAEVDSLLLLVALLAVAAATLTLRHTVARFQLLQVLLLAFELGRLSGRS